MKIFLSIVCGLAISTSTAQMEYLVSVNRETAEFTHLNDLPVVEWPLLNSSTFDAVQNRYFFLATDNTISIRLVTVDATTGEMLFDPLLPTYTDGSNFNGFHYCEIYERLYALRWNMNSETQFLLSVDIESAELDTIAELPMQAISEDMSTIDQENGRFIFHGTDTDGIQRLYTVDLLSGNIIGSPECTIPSGPDILSGFVFDHEAGVIRCVHWSISILLWTSLVLNPSTGQFGSVIPLSMVNGIDVGTCTFDDGLGIYTFMGGSNGESHIVSLDVETEEILYFPTVQEFPSPQDHLRELEYNRNTGELFGVRWEQVSTASTEIQMSEQIQLYPNPCDDQLALRVSSLHDEISYTIVDAAGRTVRLGTYMSVNESISTNHLATGVYSLQIENASDEIVVRKFVVSR